MPIYNTSMKHIQLFINPKLNCPILILCCITVAFQCSTSPNSYAFEYFIGYLYTNIFCTSLLITHEEIFSTLQEWLY